MSFASRTVAAHLARGLLGFGLVALAVIGFGRFGWPVLLAAPLAVWAFRGCPMCWTVGLFETLSRRARRVS